MNFAIRSNQFIRSARDLARKQVGCQRYVMVPDDTCHSRIKLLRVGMQDRIWLDGQDSAADAENCLAHVHFIQIVLDGCAEIIIFEFE